MSTVASLESRLPSLATNLKLSAPLYCAFGLYCTLAVQTLAALQSGVAIEPSEPCVGPCPATTAKLKASSLESVALSVIVFAVSSVAATALAPVWPAATGCAFTSTKLSSSITNESESSAPPCSTKSSRVPPLCAVVYGSGLNCCHKPLPNRQLCVTATKSPAADHSRKARQR